MILMHDGAGILKPAPATVFHENGKSMGICGAVVKTTVRGASD
jgi:hypothetical protein